MGFLRKKLYPPADMIFWSWPPGFLVNMEFQLLSLYPWKFPLISSTGGFQFFLEKPNLPRMGLTFHVPRLIKQKKTEKDFHRKALSINILILKICLEYSNRNNWYSYKNFRKDKKKTHLTSSCSPCSLH